MILAGNHRAVVDSFFLVLMVRRRITFVAKSEYFTGTGVKGAMQRWFFGGAGQVPIDRSGADASRAALDTAIGILDKGGVWGGIYPEGTRSPDGCCTRERPERFELHWKPGGRRSFPSSYTAATQSTRRVRGCGASARSGSR